eukprot:191276-Pelagomonas_calceolata.AAC.1
MGNNYFVVVTPTQDMAMSHKGLYLKTQDRKEKEREAGKRQARPTWKGRHEGVKSVCYQHESWGSSSSESGKEAKTQGSTLGHLQASRHKLLQRNQQGPRAAPLPSSPPLSSFGEGGSRLFEPMCLSFLN